MVHMSFFFISFSIKKDFIAFQWSEPLKFPFLRKGISHNGFSVNPYTFVMDAMWGGIWCPGVGGHQPCPEGGQLKGFIQPKLLR